MLETNRIPPPIRMFFNHKSSSVTGTFSMMLKRFLFVIACSLKLTVSQLSDDATKNPICYVCSDGGVSTITKPDVLIPLPNNTQGVSEATCETIRLSAEVLLLIPEESCYLLDNEEFRILCGCENTLDSIPTIPLASPIAVPTPVLPPTNVPVETASPSTSPIEAPTDKPIAPDLPETAVPSASPVTLISSQPSLTSSNVPSEVLSESPSTTFSSVPSHLASSVPTN